MKTEKRAYAVVRVSSAGTRWLEYKTGQFALMPFEDGDEVEVSLTASEKPSEIRQLKANAGPSTIATKE